MEPTAVTDYRLERWIALLLALLFFLPFVAQAEEAPLALLHSTDAPVSITHNGNDATLAWRCKSTGIDGFDQCGLFLDRKVLTWRMVPEGQALLARVAYGSGDVRLEVSRIALRSSRSEP
ncbi:MAG TPA: hypothetical protein VEK79_15635 [Thermoanaerobaculia bacterium]|nr:hypothetical protein [Thermoanaerobaculia bacterium]